MGSCKAETPAARAMRLLSAKRIAHACNLTTNAVWKWDKTGGGRIPSRHQPAVLALAAQLGVSFSAEDIIGLQAAA